VRQGEGPRDLKINTGRKERSAKQERQKKRTVCGKGGLRVGADPVSDFVLPIQPSKGKKKKIPPVTPLMESELGSWEALGRGFNWRGGVPSGGGKVMMKRRRLNTRMEEKKRCRADWASLNLSPWEVKFDWGEKWGARHTL